MTAQTRHLPATRRLSAIRWLTVTHRPTGAGRLVAARGLIAAIAVLAVTACAAPRVADGTPGPAHTATAIGSPALELQRTGGIAAEQARLTVAADGSWTFGTGADGTGRPARGTLTADQAGRLVTLLSDPALPAEQTTHPQLVCADTRVYTITAGTARYTYDECFRDSMPATAALVEYLDAISGR